MESFFSSKIYLKIPNTKFIYPTFLSLTTNFKTSSIDCLLLKFLFSSYKSIFSPLMNEYEPMNGLLQKWFCNFNQFEIQILCAFSKRFNSSWWENLKRIIQFFSFASSSNFSKRFSVDKLKLFQIMWLGWMGKQLLSIYCHYYCY